MEQYGRRDNIRIFGVPETPEEDPYEKVVQVAAQTGVQIRSEDISVCHRLPARSGPKPLIVKFVRRQVKSMVMAGKKTLREQNSNVYINDDLTPLRSHLAKVLRSRI